MVADRVEALVLFRWSELPDPDDPRPLTVQVNEILDGLLALVCDSTNAAWGEVLTVHSCQRSLLPAQGSDGNGQADDPDATPPGGEGG